jgi:hypothetical protein
MQINSENMLHFMTEGCQFQRFVTKLPEGGKPMSFPDIEIRMTQYT